MIRLRQDCLVFKEPDGTCTPCSVHEVTFELVGPSAQWVDRELIAHAAEAVLHYFKVEKGQTTVLVGEFSAALESVLRGLGLELESSPDKSPGPSLIQPTNPISPTSTGGTLTVETDLQELAAAEGGGCELLFFPRLRTVVHSQLKGQPVILRFRGLRACAKALAGAKRWTFHCQALQDQIVEYLRTCLKSEANREGCALVVE